MNTLFSYTVPEVETAIGIPFAMWHHQCHSISLAIVKSDLLDGPRRVARGTCRGVFGQHSWIVLSDDPYGVNVPIVDPTLWSYDDTVEGIWVGTSESVRKHTPHGAGSIWEWGKPQSYGGEPVPLAAYDSLSREARNFLDMIGPLDMRGWCLLASAPVQGGWPAKEILCAIDDDPRLTSLVPVDVIGMLTDRNPGGLYLPK